MPKKTAFFNSIDPKETLHNIYNSKMADASVATTGGKLIILSSPYAQSGALYELHKRHYGRDDSPVLIWQATAPEMNPTLPQDYLDRMEIEDPEAASRSCPVPTYSSS